MRISTFLGTMLIAPALATTAYCQIDSCNVFLQGHHVEIGISPSGSYGSSVAAPSGYHPHGPLGIGNTYLPCSSTAGTGTPLGFVADPLYTSWSTDSSAHYMGDYFLPGDPFEGWSIQIGGVQYQAFNTTGTAGFTPGLSGSNISYTPTVGNISSEWQGTVDSVQITQVTSLDSGALYFTMQVTFTNLGSTAVDDIYYFRSVDPDNDETWPGGGFPTTNTVVNQADSTLVTAYGALGTWTMLAMGTLDSNSRCLVYSDWPLSQTTDLSTLYSGSYGPADYTAGTEDNGDLSIGLVYHIAHLASVDSASDSTYRTTSAHRHPANSATIKYFYAFGPAGIDSAWAGLTSSGTTTATTAVKNINSVSPIKVYPNPASESFNILGCVAGDNVTIYDMMGRQVLSQQMTVSGINTVQVSSLPAGAYILAVADASGNMKSRTPVQKQ